MKTIKNFFFVAFISLAAFACSDDDSGTTEETNATLIIGSWKLNSLTYDGVELEEGPCLYESTLVVNATTFNRKTYVGDDILNCELVNTSNNIPYGIDGNTITGDSPGEIITLNASTLIFESSFDGQTERFTWAKQ